MSEHTASWLLDDGNPLIAFAGDWDGQTPGVRGKFLQLADIGVTRLHHVGDFPLSPDSYFLDEINSWVAEADLRIAVTPGDHENWSYINALFEAAGAGVPAHVRSHICVLPRAFRWNQCGRSLMSFGGAASFDREVRVANMSWWAAELPSTDDFAQISKHGPVDVMITHDSPIPSTAEVASIRAASTGSSDSDLAYAEVGARITTDAWKAAQPALLLHGHFHVRDTIMLPTGQRIISLAKASDRGNIVVIDLTDLTAMWLEGFDD